MAEESGSSPDIVSRVRDVRYYFEDGGVVFLCENKLYKLHKTRLALKSEFFTELFEVPQDPNSVVHGHDDNHPVNLNESGITDLDFRHLLIFLYDQDELPNPTPLQFFFSVLHLSMLWRIQSGVKYVTTHLPNHADFTPAIQLKLSRQYSLDDWAGPAFRTLIQRPLAEITLADAEHIGVVTYYKLVQLKCEVADHKVALAFHPPDVNHSFSCLDENLCSRIWESFWWGGYSKQLLHPDNKKSPASILLELDPTKGLLAQMNKVCLQNTMEAIWENNPFDEEQELADDAYSKLCAWMDTL
ncbi:BTB domain-containing protein [Mycena venus]|uniref:BTB domain-containing protein n=1 Tax=Mycena venus TaxID=2733690 RepID=A0A8H7D1C4_9AGAR|nr:BTB domain-containing protein [Mycena venus]